MHLSTIVLSRFVSRSGLALLTAVAVVVTATPAMAQKVKNATASVTIADRPGDLMTSDATASSGPVRPYVNGLEGVTATLFYASGDLVMPLGSTRRINVNFINPMQRDSDAPQSGAPVVATYASGTLYIEGLGLIPTGETHTKVVRLGVLAGLGDRAIAFRQVTNTDTLINGTPVCVTREATNTWRVSTTSTGACDLGLAPNQAAPGQVAGMFNVTTVKGKTSHTFVARYVLPFSLTVTCLTDCPPDVRP